MTITLIGRSGFVGMRLVERLIAQGCTVRIADKRDSELCLCSKQRD